MIPKVIHYIWLGGNKMPKIVKKCMKSWKKILPDFEIKRWDETNLDLNKYQFAKDAYDAKKWAFASDVFRFDILYNEGGIYLDTDVEILKNGESINKFLKHSFFTGFEDNDFVAPGLIMGCERGSKVAKDIIDIYKKTEFDVNNLDNLTICITTTNYLSSQYGLERNDKTQILEDGVVIYSTEYFCPERLAKGKKLQKTNNTYSIHHYAGSWVNKAPVIKRIYWKIKDCIFRKNKKGK